MLLLLPSSGSPTDFNLSRSAQRKLGIRRFDKRYKFVILAVGQVLCQKSRVCVCAAYRAHPLYTYYPNLIAFWAQVLWWFSIKYHNMYADYEALSAMCTVHCANIGCYSVCVCHVKWKSFTMSMILCDRVISALYTFNMFITDIWAENLLSTNCCCRTHSEWGPHVCACKRRKLKLDLGSIEYARTCHAWPPSSTGDACTRTQGDKGNRITMTKESLDVILPK